MNNKIIYILVFVSMLLSASGKVDVSIHGDLDDDLFILRSDFHKVDFPVCLQMHNPTGKFYYDSRMIRSRQIYGLIDFDKSYELDDNQFLLIMTANEREEVHAKKRLYKRTHFKSVDLYANGKVLIPSLMPEYHDLPGYPLWFGKDEKPLIPRQGDYNYYKLWENAIVNLAIVFGSCGQYKLYFVDHRGKVAFHQTIHVRKEVQNIHLIGDNPMTEVDGSVYDGEKSDDDTIRQKAIEGVIVEKNGERIFVKLPYPFVYINRIFLQGV